MYSNDDALVSFKELLSKLVSIPSHSGSEQSILQYIKQFFIEKNITPIEHDGNLIVHINNHSNKVLIFNAHMDTVPIPDPTHWDTQPYQLVEQQETYVGHGVSDEKVSIAILMELLPCFMAASCDIILTFVVNEEKDGSGSKSVVEYITTHFSYKTIACIICEPTNASWVELGNKGNIFFSLTTRGKSAHGSKPEEGENAIMKMLETVQKLQAGFKEQMVSCPFLGAPSLAFPTTIAGGTAVNTIPDTCIATGDIRTNGECHERILQFLKQAHPEIKVLTETKPYILDSGHFLIKLFEQVGIALKKYTTGSNDAVFFGQAGIPTIVFGAGNKEAIHKPNEYVSIEHIEKTKKVYAAVTDLFVSL